MATRTSGLTLVLALLAMFCATISPASAQEAKVVRRAPDPPFRLGVEAVTDFPVQLGGRIWGELPGRVQLGVSLGVLPGAYGRAITGILDGTDSIPSATREMVDDSFDSSFVFRTSLGFRLLPGRGGYLHAGYTLAIVSGEVSVDDVVEVSGLLLPPALRPRLGDSYAVQSTLHFLDAELGWRWHLGAGVTLRLAAGASFRVGGSTRAEPEGSSGSPFETALVARAGEVLIDDALEQLIVTPTVTLALGWQLWPLPGL